MNNINSVCVYSASSTKIDQTYFNAATKLGQLLAQKDIRLINGAGSPAPFKYIKIMRK